LAPRQHRHDKVAPPTAIADATAIMAGLADGDQVVVADAFFVDAETA